MIDDATLLERYVRDRSEEAFAEVVRRHLTMVYSAALRRTAGDVHRAEDVAQIVFAVLARDAAALSRHPSLTGWLYTATRNAAVDLLRTERRRQQREEKAQLMEEISLSPEASADWEQLRPVLDDAMEELDERDREAVLLRFFEGQPFASVGAAMRLSEDAARKRVDRALEKLGSLLQRRGITSTGGALTVLLANQVSVAAPASVAASITAAAMAGAGTATGMSVAGTAGIFLMSTAKIVTGILAVVAVVAIGSALYQAGAKREAEAEAASVTRERDALQARLAALEKRVRQSDSRIAAVSKETGAASPPTAAAAPNQLALQNPALEYVLEHPETHAAFVEQDMLRMKLRYGGFFKAAGLSAEQQERVLSVMKETRASQLDIMVALHTQGFGRNNHENPEAVTKMVVESARDAFRQRDASLRAVLGDEGLKAMQKYQGTMYDRNVAEQMAGRLYSTDEPLTAQQAERLMQVLAENPYQRRAGSLPGNTVNGMEISEELYTARYAQAMKEGGMSRLDWQAPVTDAALARAQAVLTPTQLTVLKQVQATQAVQFQLAPPPPGPVALAMGLMSQ
jgi:RNA polymerase sigma factor (sigma-70 family)